MNDLRRNVIIKILLPVSVLTSCVPASKLEDMTSRKDKCEEILSNMRAENLELSTKNNELNKSLEDLKRDVSGLEKDTSESGYAYRRLTSLYHEMNDSYEKLLTNNEKLSTGKAEETRKVLAELQKAQEELFLKEDELKKKEAALNESIGALKSREVRINELESLINSRDSVMKSLKSTLSDALIGYKDKGISIQEKNGMIYVSMEERLLFASGSIVVDKTGEAALKELAKVLAQNPEIKVMIEGHTDNVPISTSSMKDNWDLSVLRATSVVRILLKDSGIEAKQLTPSGRGEYLPIDTANNADARKKNRRIEVILIPDISKLLNLVNN
ncbi:MAG: OmpA family protein [Bacteroidia bacterium]